MEISDISNELLKSAAKGNMNAFEAIYKASSGFVYNVALRVTCDKEDAEETVQEVFIKLFEGLKDFQFKSAFKTWIYRVSVNTALNLRKKAGSRAGRQVEFDESIANSEMSGEDNVEKIITDNSNREIVDKMIGMLSPDYRACIVLREMQGLSYEEIAKALGLNINTVRTRLKRAREILAKEVLVNELQ